MIPKHKIKGERFAQMIYNAIVKQIGRQIVHVDDGLEICSVCDRLFYIENEELQEIIEEYLGVPLKTIKWEMQNE